jgi:uncharacterized protein (TIGR02001 family)
MDISCRRRGVICLGGGILLSTSLTLEAPRCLGADQWGGALGVTSDYIVRGISRSNDQAALQLDLHVVDTSGFLAGLFASNTQIDPYAPRDVELDGYLGLAWTAADDWHGKILGEYYAYPWNSHGSKYNYAELDLDVAYRDWLDLVVAYSPDAPRYVPYRGLIGVSSRSVEINLERRVIGKLSAASGIGYDYLGGPNATGYAYWSVGATYDLAPVLFAASYVDTSAGAKALFYNAAATGRWTGTVIWRF